MLVKRADELGIHLKFFEHTGVFAAYWTISYRRSSTPRDEPRGSHSNCAVYDRESGFEQLNVPRNFTDKIFDLERETDVQDINSFMIRNWRTDVHAKNVVVF